MFLSEFPVGSSAGAFIDTSHGVLRAISFRCSSKYFFIVVFRISFMFLLRFSAVFRDYSQSSSRNPDWKLSRYSECSVLIGISLIVSPGTFVMIFLGLFIAIPPGITYAMQVKHCEKCQKDNQEKFYRNLAKILGESVE